VCRCYSSCTTPLRLPLIPVWGWFYCYSYVPTSWGKEGDGPGSLLACLWALSISMSSLDVSIAAVLALAAASAATRRSWCASSLFVASASETLVAKTSVPLSYVQCRAVRDTNFRQRLKCMHCNSPCSQVLRSRFAAGMSGDKNTHRNRDAPTASSTRMPSPCRCPQI
jgi:hypothetical protein